MPMLAQHGRCCGLTCQARRIETYLLKIGHNAAHLADDSVQEAHPTVHDRLFSEGDFSEDASAMILAAWLWFSAA
jgi:hypothetical protein